MDARERNSPRRGRGSEKEGQRAAEIRVTAAKLVVPFISARPPALDLTPRAQLSALTEPPTRRAFLLLPLASPPRSSRLLLLLDGLVGARVAHLGVRVDVRVVVRRASSVRRTGLEVFVDCFAGQAQTDKPWGGGSGWTSRDRQGKKGRKRIIQLPSRRSSTRLDGDYSPSESSSSKS